MVTNETLPPMDSEPQQSPLDQCSTSTSSDSEAQVHARMDQLQNQLNQVLLMMQNAQGDTSCMTQHMAGILSFDPHISVPTKITGIHSFNSTAKMYSFIASNISKTSFIWIIDSGATYHICISLGLMHNITVSLPYGHKTQVYYAGSVHLTPTLTIHEVLYIPTFTYNLSCQTCLKCYDNHMLSSQ